MDENRDGQSRDDTAKKGEPVKDLQAKPLGEKDAQQVKGGRMGGDESPKE